MQQYPFIFSNEWKYRFQRHLAFWTFWWMFQGFLYSFIAINGEMNYFNRLSLSMVESLLFMFSHMFLSYSLMYFVIPRFLLKQRYSQTVIWTIICFLLTAAISALIGQFMIMPVRHFFLGDSYIAPPKTSYAVLHLSLLAGLRGGITIGGISAAIKLMKYWYMKEQRNLQLQKENIESQLQLLKAQVHPHFLFNTLNNIYSYTQNTSPVASRLITGLSDMLRFIIYECNQPLVPLSKELKMIQDYVNLEHIRYGNKLDLHLDIPDNTYDLHISPLVLLPFVENCFKHGASQMLEQPWISLHVSIRGKQMQMKLVNGKLNIPREEKGSPGIGIQNVKKRLDLLYPGKHELSITDEEEVFIVNLKIELEHKKHITSNISNIEQVVHA
jgi:sensor histidine kinase YesM